VANTLANIAEWVWNVESVGARVARVALTPASALFAVGVARRNARFDADLSRSNGDRRYVRTSALPAISVGNLTVGGTGKTPVAAWCARQLWKAGAKPAIVLRGYGDDEWRVHALLNRGVPVVVAPDRLNGIASAKAQGANCVVLDDAFQHRRASRVADIVLLSADQWTGNARLLPSGPFREPLSALRRASAVVITVKAADASRIEALQTAILSAVPGAAIALARLTLGDLKLAVMLSATGANASQGAPPTDRTGMLDRPIAWLAGKRILAVSAIGDPAAFATQLCQSGASVESVSFRDHHAFSASDAAMIARRAESLDGVVCTLKDAVKLGPLWPRVAPPLWYVSQSVVVERGASALDRALARVLAAREVK
jgi:tetraacyldisaccharide 4'-kinase